MIRGKIAVKKMLNQFTVNKRVFRLLYIELVHDTNGSCPIKFVFV